MRGTNVAARSRQADQGKPAEASTIPSSCMAELPCALCGAGQTDQLRPLGESGAATPTSHPILSNKHQINQSKTLQIQGTAGQNF